jgi:hypothetical protein
MLDPASLATAAVAVMFPYLLEAAKGAAGKIGEDVYEDGKKLVSWLRGKLSGDNTKALDRVAADPTNADKQAALRVSLSEALEENQPLQDELAALLKSMPSFAVTQNMNQIGNGNIGVQNTGSGNSMNIGKN